MERSLLSRIWNGLLNLIYPEEYFCINCGSYFVFSELQGICPECTKKLHIMEEYCSLCGRGLINLRRKKILNSSNKGNKERELLCSYCREEGFSFEKARSAACYNGMIRDLILKFKYEGCKQFKNFFGSLLYCFLCYYYGDKSIDIIIPVPLHKKRFEERGYNQVNLVGEQLSKRSGLPLITDLLLRVDNNPPLYNYALKDRRRLLENSFALDDRKKCLLKDRTVLLVDDIFTTGTTVDLAGRLLKEKGGAQRVLVLTLATAITY